MTDSYKDLITELNKLDIGEQYVIATKLNKYVWMRIPDGYVLYTYFFSLVDGTTKFITSVFIPNFIK